MDIESLIYQVLLVHVLEYPGDRFHEIQIHGIIRMIHIRPSSDPVAERPPFVAGGADGFPAFLDEFLDTDLVLDILLAVDAQELLYIFLYRQTVAIPSSIPVHLISFHGLVSEDGILHGSYESVPEMRCP